MSFPKILINKDYERDSIAINYTDEYLAMKLYQIFNISDEECELIKIISAISRAGHTCLNLEELKYFPDVQSLFRKYDPDVYYNIELNTRVFADKWEFKPIVSPKKGVFYLQKYYVYENIIENKLKEMSNKSRNVDIHQIKEVLSKYFPSTEEIDWQKAAAVSIILNKLTIISGGPGTGKTSTVSKSLSAFLELFPDMGGSIAVTAPTGKAVARLKESLVKSLSENEKSSFTEIFQNASTVHSLLGYSSKSGRIKYNSKNKLPYYMLIVDEASMISAELFARLLDAINDDCSIILLGDKDQLSSVEPGSVFSDIVRDADTDRFSLNFSKKLSEILGHSIKSSSNELPLQDNIIRLSKNYRFKDNSIGRVASLVRDMASIELADMMEKESFDDSVDIFPLSICYENLIDETINWYSRYSAEKDYNTKFNIFDSYRIITANRVGRYGSVFINNMIEMHIYKNKLSKFSPIGYFHGRPIIILENDHKIGVYNGDTGVIIEDRGKYFALLPSLDGKERIFLLQKLPKFESAFAVTIHKSQGSEFSHTAVVLPEYDSDLVTKELIYTGITRGRTKVTLYCEKDILLLGMMKVMKRMSLLKHRLYN